MTYSQKLRDPRWQKKRLKIFERDGWACILCGQDDKELNAHHTSYSSGAEPWEYPDCSIQTLCNPCHKMWHLIEKSQGIVVAWAPISKHHVDGVCVLAWTGEEVAGQGERDGEYVCTDIDGSEVFVSYGAGMGYRRPVPSIKRAQISWWINSCVSLTMEIAWGVERKAV